MKEKLREHRKQKEKRNQTGPGKYLKIENWASGKDYPNGFQSKGPKLKIYNWIIVSFSNVRYFNNKVMNDKKPYFA